MNPTSDSGETGIFTISLDFELYWGVRDKRSLAEYEASLHGVKNAIVKMLELFDRYDIHATWATVGFLFAKDRDELLTFIPEKKPSYRNAHLNPYPTIEEKKPLEPVFHFAPEWIDLIRQHPHQEIATHTFSHYYCLEQGQSAEEFSSDLAAAVQIAKEKNISLDSLVFPRNQWNEEYLSTMTRHKIRSYRGNEKSWMYQAADAAGQHKLRRAARLLDAYLNLSGANSHPLDSIGKKPPYNIPSSRFLRPVSKKLSLMEGLRKRRITHAIRHAALHNELFHLWWHPHNFGLHLEENLRFLESILSFVKEMKTKHQMRTMNMHEISDWVSTQEEQPSERPGASRR